MVLARITFPICATAAALLSGCGGTSAAVLRVRPPPPTAGVTAEAQRLRVQDAVREEAATVLLECTPPKPPNDEILGCWPADLGASPEFVSLHLRAARDGYEVSILESFRGFSGPRRLCSIQDDLAERLELRFGSAVVERDARLTCPARAR